MPFIQQIVNHINAQLVTNAFKDVKFSGLKMHGIAISVPEISQGENGDKIRWIPMEAEDFDNNKDCRPDDTYPLQIYHRVNSAGPQSTNTVGNYGDGLKSVKDAYVMSLIVHGDRQKLRMNMYDLESLIAANLPTELPRTMKTDLKMHQCTITVMDRVFDPFRVWVDEYRTLENIGLKPNSLYFRINYRVEQQFDKSCYALCNC